MPQSYSYWRRFDFVRSDTLIRSAIARWRLAGVEWLRAIFAFFLAPVPAGRCRERPGSSPAVVPPPRPSFVLLFTSHGRRHLRPAPQVHSRPSSSISRSRSCTYCHAFLCSRHSVSGEPRVVQPFILLAIRRKARRIRTPSGPAVHLHSLSAARRAHPDPEWSRRSSSLAIRRQEGVSGPRVVQPFIFTRHLPPGRRIRSAGGPGFHLHPLSAARKAYPDHERSRRLSSLAIRCQEGVSGLREVQPFIFTRYPPPGRRIGTPSGPSVHLQSLSAARRAVPDRDWSRRSSSLVYPPPGRRIRSRGANRSS